MLCSRRCIALPWHNSIIATTCGRHLITLLLITDCRSSICIALRGYNIITPAADVWLQLHYYYYFVLALLCFVIKRNVNCVPARAMRCSHGRVLHYLCVRCISRTAYVRSNLRPDSSEAHLHIVAHLHICTIAYYCNAIYTIIATQLCTVAAFAKRPAIEKLITLRIVGLVLPFLYCSIILL